MSSPATTSVTVASPSVSLRQPVAERGGVDDGGERDGVGGELLDVLVVAGERVVPAQERDRALGGRAEVGGGGGGERVDPVGVRVPHLGERRQAAVRAAQFGELSDPGGGRARGFAADTADERGDPVRRLRERVGGLPGELLDRLELGRGPAARCPGDRSTGRRDRRVRGRPASGSGRWRGCSRRPAVSYTAAVGEVSAALCARARQSEMPRTRSALPTRASGPVPAGREAA